MSNRPNLDDYVDVAERLVEFREKYPEGSVQSDPFVVVEVPHEEDSQRGGGRVTLTKTFVSVRAMAYRTPDDPRPGVGQAWEPFPGRTPYTRDSELQNAETSAWGRAIVAALAADTKRGIASSQEVRNRREEPRPVPPGSADAVARVDLLRYAESIGMSAPTMADRFKAETGENVRTATADVIRPFMQQMQEAARAESS